MVQPLFDFLKNRMDPQGRKVAQQMYNCSGTVTHHNTDLWGDSAPQDNYVTSTWWPLGSAWMATHVIEYYRFTGNATALEEMLDYLIANAQFALDFMTPWNDTYMVTNPSLSPENSYYLPGSNTTSVAVTAGPTIDNSILYEIFGFIDEIQA
jgi:alpha-L-fucosidase 2